MGIKRTREQLGGFSRRGQLRGGLGMDSRSIDQGATDGIYRDLADKLESTLYRYVATVDAGDGQWLKVA